MFYWVDGCCRPRPDAGAAIVLELWHKSFFGTIGSTLLASLTLSTSQLLAEEDPKTEVQVAFNLVGGPALPAGSVIALTVSLPPASQTDVEKVQAELNDAKSAAHTMDITRQEGVLRHLRAVTEMIGKLHEILDEASQVCFADFDFWT